MEFFFGRNYGSLPAICLMKKNNNKKSKQSLLNTHTVEHLKLASLTVIAGKLQVTPLDPSLSLVLFYFYLCCHRWSGITFASTALPVSVASTDDSTIAIVSTFTAASTLLHDAAAPSTIVYLCHCHHSHG